MRLVPHIETENSPARFKKRHILKYILLVATFLIVVATQGTEETYEAKAQELKVIEIVEVKTHEAEIEYKIRKTFPENPDLMVAVAQCESSLNQNAVSHTRDFGVMQINEAVWDDVAKEMGLDYKNSIDDNIKMAQHIYEVQSVTAWVCYNKNMHLAYLN